MLKPDYITNWKFGNSQNSQWPIMSHYIFTFCLNVSLKYSLGTAHKMKILDTSSVLLCQAPHTAPAAGKVLGFMDLFPGMRSALTCFTFPTTLV